MLNYAIPTDRYDLTENAKDLRSVARSWYSLAVNLVESEAVHPRRIASLMLDAERLLDLSEQLEEGKPVSDSELRAVPGLEQIADQLELLRVALPFAGDGGLGVSALGEFAEAIEEAIRAHDRVDQRVR